METFIKYVFNILVSILLFTVAYSGIYALFLTNQSSPCLYGQNIAVPCMMQPFNQGLQDQIYPRGGMLPTYPITSFFTPQTNILLSLLAVSLIYMAIAILCYFRFSYIWSAFALGSVYTYISGLIMSMQGGYVLQFVTSLIGLILIAAVGYALLYKGNLHKQNWFPFIHLDTKKDIQLKVNTKTLITVILTIIAVVLIYWVFMAITAQGFTSSTTLPPTSSGSTPGGSILPL